MPRWCFTILLLALPAGAAPAADPTPAQAEYFEKSIRPILADNCYSCHGEKKQSGGLRLDTAAGISAGTDGEAVVVAGEPAKSRLIRSVNRQGDFPMPPKKALPAEAVAALTEWVKAGAAYPSDQAKKTGADGRNHWAFQPVKPPAVPQVKVARGAIQNEIDAFILPDLAKKGLAAAPRADRRTLIRRAYYDLIGLPPPAAEVEAFENDSDPAAWEKLIDRLLASPHYGERWARYWLDLARYADTKGYVLQDDRSFPYAYTYRDYVIRTFNDDKPYDRFILEQLAADKLPLGDDRRPLAALGFLTLGRRFLNNAQDIIDDRIDVVTRGLMGLTVTCARCHDHKYDPIPTADYYSLYGVFASSIEPKELPLIEKVARTPELIAFEKELRKREAEYDAEVEKRYRAHLAKLREPAVVAEYLRGALEARGKEDRALQAFARERDLIPYALVRWRAFIQNETKDWSPVFGPLVLLADVTEKDFERKADEVIAGLGKTIGKPVNPLILRALRNAKPKSLKEAVAAIACVIAATPPAGPPSDDQAAVFKAFGAGGPIDIPLADAERLRNRADRDALAALKRKIDAFKASSPVAPPRAHVLNDAPSPTEPHILIRGNPNNPGPAVPRQAPAVIAPNRTPFAQGSGRLELARAIASSDNPLTARVLVNRVWAGHFGEGLVRTPSDFGTRSEPPTHPALLDWLAIRFVKDGWSVKKLHRLIMLSATYQRSSAISSDAARQDPDNQLLSHQNRRRLDFEALRDSFLAVSGKLDIKMGGKPVDLFKQPFSGRRTVYGIIDRTNFPATMRTFDVASPDQHAPQRHETTVPQQALFLMNSPFVTEQARALAERPEIARTKSPTQKVEALYKLALGRRPTTAETELAVEFVGTEEMKSGFGPLEQLAQVLLLSNEFAFVD
jgi:mono/diheme cytochrome c family protein